MRGRSAGVFGPDRCGGRFREDAGSGELNRPRDFDLMTEVEFKPALSELSRYIFPTVAPLDSPLVPVRPAFALALRASAASDAGSALMSTKSWLSTEVPRVEPFPIT